MLIAAGVPILLMGLANLGSSGADARDITTAGPVRRPGRGAGTPVAVPDVRLEQLRSTQTAGEPPVLRNPFALAPRSLPQPTPGPPPVAIAITPQAPPDIPQGVPLSLIGVATTTRADGRIERTAIIVAGPADPLYMVREADTVAARYRVDAILPDSVLLVEITTAAAGASLRLALR